ncbi:MAG TPA: amidohydrolase family protein [Anaerolineaceae bacterium]|nr:amidohydrolase family protein [Anaerolineaceae bacterium]
MIRIDAHLHCSGKENTNDILHALDAAKIDLAVLLAPFLNAPYELTDAESLRNANRYLGDLVRGHSDRLVGFAVVNPLHPSAVDDLEMAIARDQLKGLKLVPSGWYPYDDCAHRVYAKANELRIPILFHAGIFIDGRSSRFCRPVYFEAVREHPGLRVTLAHLGWPWTDEAIALGLIDLINHGSPAESQFRFDISFGPPPIYRQPALEKALAVLGAELLQFGSDRFFPCSGGHILSAIEEVERLCDTLQVEPAQRAEIFGGTAARWLGLPQE